MAAESGVRFGNFDILRDEAGRLVLLGKGSFGSTYKARHRFLDTIAALKVINQSYAADPAVRRRFLDEGRAVAKLSHPHIARIHDFGEADGMLYYVMEYCAGGDLFGLLKKRGALSVAAVLEIARQVASALDCAHREGFIHRDLKPSNVMLAGGDGSFLTKLIDFGLVQSIAVANAETVVQGEEEHFIGTPLYASPEQLREEPLDPRSDLFSLGMTMWHLLAGTPPEQGPPPRITASRLSDEPYDERLPAGLPKELRDLLSDLLAKERGKRTASAAEALDAIEFCAAQLGVPLSAGSASSVATASSILDTEASGVLAVRNLGTPIEADFQILRRSGEEITGVNYLARPARGQAAEVWLHALRPPIAAHAQSFHLIRRNAARLSGLALPALLQPRSIHVYTDQTAIVLAAASSVTLLDELRSRGVVRLADVRPLLHTVADCSDRLLSEDLPGIQIAPDRIFLRWPDASDSVVTGTKSAQPLSAASPAVLPRFLRNDEAPDLDAGTPDSEEAITMTTETLAGVAGGDDACAALAMLIYRITAGRSCPTAASVSAQGYVAVPALSEQSNRLLSLAIAHQGGHTSCSHLLRDILRAEGLLDSSHPGAALSSSAGARTGVVGRRVAATTSVRTETHRTPVAPIRPSGSPTPAAPAPPQELRKRGAYLLAGFAILLTLTAAGVWLWKKPHPVAESVPPAKSSASPHPGSASLLLPADAALRIEGQLPPQAAFSVAGHPVQATAGANQTSVPLGKQSLPVEVTVSAQGFAPVRMTIANPSDLDQPRAVSMVRSKGTLVFIRPSPSDFSHAVIKMVEPLPEDQGRVDIERFPRGKEISGSRDEIALPTGVYQVILKSANDRIVAPRVVGTFTLRAGGATELQVPPTLAGKYSGEVHASAEATGSAITRELTIDPGLATGSLIEHRDGAIRSAGLVAGRLDANGVYSARVQLSRSSGGATRYDEVLALHPAGDGQFEVTFVEAQEDDRAIESQLKRKPFGEDQYRLAGRMRRE